MIIIIRQKNKDMTNFEPDKTRSFLSIYSFTMISNPLLDFHLDEFQTSESNKANDYLRIAQKWLRQYGRRFSVNF